MKFGTNMLHILPINYFFSSKTMAHAENASQYFETEYNWISFLKILELYNFDNKITFEISYEGQTFNIHNWFGTDDLHSKALKNKIIGGGGEGGGYKEILLFILKESRPPISTLNLSLKS